MLEKDTVLAELKKSAKQYGLSAEILDVLASSANIEDESSLSVWIDSQRPIMSAMQKSLDAVRSKRSEDKEPSLGGGSAEKLEQMIEAKLAAITDKYEQKVVALEQKLQESENRASLVDFQEKVKRIGNQLGLHDDVLALVSSSLRSDMSEDDIKNSLSQTKATLVKAGLPVEETAHRKATNEEQLRKDAKDWVERQAQKLKTE